MHRLSGERDVKMRTENLWGYEAIWVQEAIYGNRTSRNIYEDGPDKC
jgi:hypothetical protein